MTIYDKLEKAIYDNPQEASKIIDQLVKDGMYPKLTAEAIASGLDYPEMIKGYGPEWFIYHEPHFCPNCKSDLRSPIGPPFKREIGIETDEYDGVSYYQCPDCGHKWKAR